MHRRESVLSSLNSRVSVKYFSKNEVHTIVGVITSCMTTKFTILVSKGDDMDGEETISIFYPNIITIDQLNSFFSYLRKVRIYLNKEEYQKAFDELDVMQGIFKREDQQSYFDKLKQMCMTKLFLNARGK